MSGQRELWVYDGRTVMGSFTLDDKTGEAVAYSAGGELLGTFSGQKGALAAIEQRYQSDSMGRAA